MPLLIVQGDITEMSVDIIVNAANESLLGGGGVDGAIHHAAGPQLLEECRTLGGCQTGEAKITDAYDLDAQYIIHTVGPVYIDGQQNEETLLISAYRNSLQLASEHSAQSIAFPLISAGAYGYPKDQALHVATSEILKFLENHEMTVYLVLYDKVDFMVKTRRMMALEHYLNRNIVFENRMMTPKFMDYEGLFEELGETFSERLLRLIDERDFSDSSVYKKANIDRRHFSKIRNNKNYQPSKNTVLAFAVALELDLQETNDLLRSAGYSISDSSRFDLIIEYFIENGLYNIHELNEVLFYFDENLLGG